ncbi:hypothetical protein Lfu02_69320 [Longispora fulva]|nr:hypothetical protein Lfu02_69320 [Longispora fulva]
MLSRRRWLVGAAVLIAVAGAVVGIRVFYPGQWSCVVGAGHVPVPADDAGPDVVVRTYLRALSAHDRSTAQELYPGGVDGKSCNIRSIQDVRVAAVSVTEDRVRVTAQYTQTSFDEAESGSADGPVGRNYYLDRTRDRGTWRIVDAGQG